uniref:VQ motif-containing protein 9 isoform X2 n=2 Tax=Cicer arietinum TaxID=3827 RepID=A0A3Q7XBC0_CICAR|nr:VQ motif-containing protein 9 isoform X2 [Cicer arietinum]
MDKSCQSSADSTNNSSSRDHYLRHLNKLSQKITKPIIKKPSFDPPPLPPPPPPPQPQNQNQNQIQNQNQNQNQNTNNNNNNNNPLQPQPQPQQNLQHQPPVYNINKNDFRDVVQKLTGSPAHDRISTPPPIQQPKPQSSRLQRIRPPPLPHITNRPPPLLNTAIPRRPQHQNFNFNPVNFNHNFPGFGRPLAPLSPLPPFPTVHAPAESPISAYMRDLQNLVSTMDSKGFTGFSPLPPPISSPHPPPEQQQQQQQQHQQQQQPQHQQQHQHQQQQPPPQQQGFNPAQMSVQTPSPFPMPSSPTPFGCSKSTMERALTSIEAIGSNCKGACSVVCCVCFAVNLFRF